MKTIALLFSMFFCLSSVAWSQLKGEFYFEKGKGALENTELAAFRMWVAGVRPEAADAFVVEAYSDASGEEETNMMVCQQRADFVSEYLRQSGAQSVAQQVFGESKSVAKESDSTACAKERKVVVRYLPGPDKPISLSAFFEPKRPQLFRINPKEENVLKGAEGTTVYLPAKAFNRTYPLGPDSVDIFLTEYTGLGDMVQAGLNTMSTEGPLQTGGSIAIEGFETSSGKPLVLGKPYGVAFSGRAADDRMDTWYARSVEGVSQNENSNGSSSSTYVDAKPMQMNFNCIWERRQHEYTYIFRETGIYGNHELTDLCKRACREHMDANKEKVEIFSSNQIDPKAFEKAGLSEVRFEIDGQCFSAITQREFQYTMQEGDNDQQRIIIALASFGFVNCDRLLSLRTELAQFEIEGAEPNDFYAVIFPELKSIIPCAVFEDKVYVNTFPVNGTGYLLRVKKGEEENQDFEVVQIKNEGNKLTAVPLHSTKPEVLAFLKSI